MRQRRHAREGGRLYVVCLPSGLPLLFDTLGPCGPFIGVPTVTVRDPSGEPTRALLFASVDAVGWRSLDVEASSCACGLSLLEGLRTVREGGAVADEVEGEEEASGRPAVGLATRREVELAGVDGLLRVASRIAERAGGEDDAGAGRADGLLLLLLGAALWREEAVPARWVKEAATRATGLVVVAFPGVEAPEDKPADRRV